MYRPRTFLRLALRRERRSPSVFQILNSSCGAGALFRRKANDFKRLSPLLIWQLPAASLSVGLKPALCRLPKQRHQSPFDLEKDMFDSSSIIVGLEIGTSKVCAVVGDLNPEGALNIIGLGQARSRGVRKGEISDISL